LIDHVNQLRETFLSTCNIDLLESCIRRYKDVLDLLPSCLDRAGLCANLAVLLQEHFDRTGNLSELNDAIALQREVINLRSDHDPRHGKACSNLVTSLLKCFNQTGNDAILREALVLSRKAYKLDPVEHTNRSFYCAILSVSLKTNFERTGGEELLDEAILLG
jgi:hypothetical protein